MSLWSIGYCIMKVLVACEFSGVVREAFLAKGHDAYSCDLIPTTWPCKGRHYTQDVRSLLCKSWDLIIAHPPCTYLSKAGIHLMYKDESRWHKMLLSCIFFIDCLLANASRICVENPVMHRFASSRVGVNYQQVIHPYQFGHHETKATCLWLRGLPLLKPTNIVKVGNNTNFEYRRMRGHLDRGRLRSITYSGIAKAMADQWS